MNRRAMLCTLLLATSLLASPVIAQDTPAAEAPAAPVEAADDARITVAILPFQTRPKIDTRVAAAMATKLTGVLETTGRFDFFPRSSMTDLRSTLEFTRKGYVKPASAAAWGAGHNIDYVITGMVVAAGKGHGGMGVGGVRINAKAISLAIDIHLVDCSRGKAVIEDTFKEEKAGLGLALGTVDFDPESRRGSEMIAVVLRKLTRTILATVAPPQVVVIDESGLVVALDYGSNVFEQGQRWELFTPGQVEVDPETGEKSTSKATKTGAIRITVVQESATAADVVDGTAAVGAIAKFDKPGKKKKKKKKDKK